MRKLAAILLCGIFFFNWVGYRLLNNMMEEEATRRLDARLDEQQYDENQLITIKVPLTDLAYYNNSVGFERSNGQIQINGIPYRYVKRRIYHDSLEMLCIPNQGALTLRQLDKNYFNVVNDIEQHQTSKSGSHPASHRSFLSDPYTVIAQMRVKTLPLGIVLRGDCCSAQLSSVFFPMDERPPAVAC